MSACHDGLARREPRAHCCDSRVGPCSQLARQSREPLALQVEGGPIRGLQRFLRDVPGEEAQMRWTYPRLVAAEMGAPDGVRLWAATGFVTKGTDSVGGAQQD